MNLLKTENTIPHYYGDTVRALFLFGGSIMLLGLPILLNYIQIPSFFAVFGVLLISVAAGFTNPSQKWDAAINAIVSSTGFMVFGIYAISFYQKYGLENKLFIANLFLGFVFLFAVYFSVKTLRGLLLNNTPNGKN